MRPGFEVVESLEDLRSRGGSRRRGCRPRGADERLARRRRGGRRPRWTWPTGVSSSLIRPTHFGVGGVDDHFFGELAEHAFAVDVRARSRRLRRRSTRCGRRRRRCAWRGAGLRPAAAAGVLEDVDVAGGVGVAEEDVGDELLEAGVLLHLAAGAVGEVVGLRAGAAGNGSCRPRSLGSGRGRGRAGGNDEDLFRGDGGHGESFRE